MKSVIRGHYSGGFRLANLKAIRRNSGKTQEQVAKELDIRISTYRNWEQEKNNPSPDNMAKLATFLIAQLMT